MLFLPTFVLLLIILAAAVISYCKRSSQLQFPFAQRGLPELDGELSWGIWCWCRCKDWFCHSDARFLIPILRNETGTSTMKHFWKLWWLFMNSRDYKEVQKRWTKRKGISLFCHFLGGFLSWVFWFFFSFRWSVSICNLAIVHKGKFSSH